MASVSNRTALSTPSAALTAGEAATRAALLTWFEAGLRAVDPRACTAAVVRRLRASGELPPRVSVLAVGKAADGMLRGAAESVGFVGGRVLGLGGGAEAGHVPTGVRRLPAAHPEPHAEAASAGLDVLRWARGLTRDDVVLVLVSGGASSMLELPVSGVSVSEIQRRTRALLAGGAEISEINRARARWSRLKGGRLGREMMPARVVNVVLSDVFPHGPEVVGSGPTVFEGATTHVAADGRFAAWGVAEAARRDGMPARVHEDPLRGEARRLGPELAGRREAGLVVYFGEPHVTVTGAGRGGRCRELALSALPHIGAAALLAAGTDGVDGAVGAAGALVDAAAARRARSLGLEVASFLARNDSATFFERVGTEIVTGATGTNVADLVLVLGEDR